MRRLKLFADYRQIHVESDPPRGDLADAWTVQATEDRVAAAGDVVAIGTHDAVEVAVEVAILDAAPALDPRAEHVTEAPLAIASNVVVVAGCTDYRPKAKRFPIAPGDHVVRASHRGLAKGKETIRVEIFPRTGPSFDARVLVRFVPPPPKKPKRTTALRTAKAAAKAAREGRIDEALDALRAMADAGDAAAAASVAEILAFRGEWASMVPYAMQLLAEPDAVYAGNVFSDLTRLVRRAARELDDPSVIERAAAVVPSSHAERRDATLRREYVDPTTSRTPEPERFAEAAREAAAGKRFRGKPVELAAHLFAVAVVLNVEDEIVARWDPTNPGLFFHHATSVARVLAKRGESERAWAILEGHLPRWWAVDHAQIAPVEVVVDPVLAPLITGARAEQILRTPRGAEAG